jgi:Protein of unknown function (DUF2752)
MRLLWRRRAANEPDHELIWLAVSATSIAGGAAWLALALPWPRCLFLAVTGLPCVTCGATRCLIAFLHGDFLSALRWNPLAFVALCALIAFDLYAAIVLVGRRLRLRIVDWTVTEKNLARIAVISLLALNWIYLLAHRSRF